MAARWDNKKENLSYKDLFQMELFMGLLPKLAKTSLYAVLNIKNWSNFPIVKGILWLVKETISLYSIVDHIVIPLFIYLSRQPKQSTEQSS